MSPLNALIVIECKNIIIVLENSKIGNFLTWREQIICIYIISSGKVGIARTCLHKGLHSQVPLFTVIIKEWKCQ